jgi:hypothetical protein
MLRKYEVAGMPADSRNGGQAENVNPEREIRRVKGGYKFRWLIRDERDVVPPPAISRTLR